MNVIKRDGRKEPLDINKIHRALEHACSGSKNVSISQIEIKAHIQFFDGIHTSDIDELLIKSAASLISEETPDYQIVASALINNTIRKYVYNIEDPKDVPHLLSIVRKNTDLGLYDSRIIEAYSEEEFEYFNKKINHNKDYDLTYASMVQFKERYLVRNRVTEEFFETPQVAYMLIAMCSFMHYPKESRKKYVVNAYKAFSDGAISVPTPILSGCRTPQYQYSSCTLIEVDDSLDSINAAASAVVKYASQKAGIGLNISNIRALKSPIRNGDAYHTGVIPFIKYLEAALKSCSQGGVRGSAGTVYYQMWHYEFPELVVLKNNKGTDESRARKLDYGVQINGYLDKRLLANGNITLFSPHDVPGLLHAFYTNQEEFARLYEKYEKDPKIRKRVYPAAELFTMLMLERSETGRIYIQNVDNTNKHSPFDEDRVALKMSNLCAEITLPTKPLENILDPDGEIALCILSAINWGVVTLDTMEYYCDIAVRFLDAIIDIQSYPVKAAETSTMKYRSLGIGITNLAYALAKIGAKYGDKESLEYASAMMEAQQYFCMKASVQLAKEFGSPNGVVDIKRFTKGISPIDTQSEFAKESANVLGADVSPKQDWASLVEELTTYGIRNATLTAIMPVETSSVIIGATNGIEPPRALISTKANKDWVVRLPVPGIKQYGKKYQLLWDDVSTEGYLLLVAIIQMWVDQSISTNTSYNPENFPGGEVPLQVLLKDLVTWYRLGGKTLYYNNTYDGAGLDSEEDSGCAGGACKL